MQSSLDLPICSGCGANIPSQTQRQDCKLCKTPYADPPLRIGPPADGLQVVQVRAGFICRSCGFKSPLRGLVEQMSVRCAQCGLTQRIYPEWVDVYHAIRATADLGGPFGALRDADDEVARLRQEAYQNVAITRPNNEIAYEADQELISVAASPGFPVCCGQPLTVSIEDGTTTTRCARCGLEHRYRVPAEVTPKNHGVVGVISTEHQIDIARVSRGDGGAVVSLKCPSCGGGLPAPQGAKSATCEYCGNTALVPQTRSEPDPSMRWDSEPFWLLIKGTSPKRARFEKEALARQQKIERSKQNAAKRAAVLEAEAEEYAERSRDRRKKLVLVLAAVAAGVGIAAFVWLIQ